MNKVLLRCAVAVVVAAGLVLGSSIPGWSYVAVKAGLFLPNSDDDGLQDWDNGFGGELALGGDFGSFAVDGGIGYFRTEPSAGGDLDLAIIPLTVTGKFLIKPSAALTLYLGGGLGYYVGLLGGDAVSNLDSDDKTGTGIGFHAVGGVEVPLGPVGFLAEVKWAQADVEFGDADDSTNLGGITLLAGVKF